MAIVSEKLQEKLDVLNEKIRDCFLKNDHLGIINAELKKWDLLPAPKEIYDESFHIAKSLIEEYIELKNEKEAINWSKKIQECDLGRFDCGEREFILGKTLFEFHHFQDSINFIQIAYKKSKGREFKGKDPKYLDFYLHPEKYIKES
ncbi:hypothetical protein [Snodgrassella communis]|uniref:hypothetical protein n=1 Tax=Snodgrassella communis TaxID=2946699 RepID=UPI001EF6B04A|nr:hypothetical protein [Snodgrassella communis]